MKRYFKRGIRVGILLPLFAGIALALTGIGAGMAADQDCDGIDDAVELLGCNATVGVLPVGPEVQKYFPNCPGYNGINPVDATIRDVFVILLAKQDPMDLSVVTPPIQPDEWLNFIPNTQPKRMRAHRVLRDLSNYCKCVLAPAGQTACSDSNCMQKALRIHEDNSSSLDDTGNIVGITGTQACPMTAGNILIYTEAIAEDIRNACPVGKPCEFTDESGVTYKITDPSQLAYLYRNMKKYVIGHESGHTMMLRAECTPDLACHYKENTGWLMDMSAYRKTTNKRVTWTIPHQHSTDDVPKLKQQPCP